MYSEPSSTVLLPDVMFTMYARHPLGRSILVPPWIIQTGTPISIIEKQRLRRGMIIDELEGIIFCAADEPPSNASLFGRIRDTRKEGSSKNSQ